MTQQIEGQVMRNLYPGTYEINGHILIVEEQANHSVKILHRFPDGHETVDSHFKFDGDQGNNRLVELFASLGDGNPHYEDTCPEHHYYVNLLPPGEWHCTFPGCTYKA